MHGNIRKDIFAGVGVNSLSLSHVAAEEEVERRNGGGQQESERRDAFKPRRENQGRASARSLPGEASTCFTLRLYIHSSRALGHPSFRFPLLSLLKCFHLCVRPPVVLAAR